MAQSYDVNYRLERIPSSFFMFLAIVNNEVLELQYEDNTGASLNFQKISKVFRGLYEDVCVID